MPPKSFSRIELKLAGALDTGPVEDSDLEDRPSATTWQFFLRENWDVDDKEYNLLLPSMRLASWLLEVGIPYFATYLPAEALHKLFIEKKQEGRDLDEEEFTIPLKKSFTSNDLRITRRELEEVAKICTWQVNPDMWTLNKWLGITRTVANAEKPWRELDGEDIAYSDADLKKQGKKRRDLVIGIAGEYVQALKNYPSNHEAHARAVFYTAVTMTHEVAHAVWHQDFRSMDYNTFGYEPWVENDRQAELGLSFISWIFSGYTPEMCDMGDSNHLVRLQDPLAWKPRSDLNWEDINEVWSSIPISYIQKILRKAFWNNLGDCHQKYFSSKAKTELNPMGFPPQNAPAPATAVIPLWTIVAGLPKWKTGAAMKTNPRPIRGDEVTAAEIDWDLNKPFKIRTPANVDPVEYARFARNLMQNMQENFEDDEEELGTGLAIEASGTQQQEGSKPLLEPFDGYLKEDLAWNPKDVNTVIQIAVRYQPSFSQFEHVGSNSAKRPQYEDGEDEEDEGDLRGQKLLKTGNTLHSLGSLEKLENLIANSSTAKLVQMTHLEVEIFCQKHHIPYRKPVNQSETWKYSQLQLENKEDAAVVQRIRQFDLDTSEKKFTGNLPALIKIQEARLIDLEHWSDKDLASFLQKQGLSLASAMNAIGDRNTHLRRVREFLQALLDIDKSTLKDQERADKPITADEDNILKRELELWSNEKLEDYIHSNNLSGWGGRDAWLIRVFRHQKGISEGGPTSDVEQQVKRKGLINRSANGDFFQRTDQNGVERYGFKGIFQRCSVTSLKTKLFKTGHFPLNVVLQLYIRGDHQLPLDDSMALNFYDPNEFRDLELVLQTQPDHELGKRAQQTTPKNTSNKSNGAGARLPHPPLDHDQLKPDELGQSSTITVGDALQALTTDGRRLLGARKSTGYRDNLRPHLRGTRAGSAMEMLESLQDLSEMRDTRNRIIDLTGDDDAATPTDATPMGTTAIIDLTGDGDDDDDDDDYPIPRPKSNMKDIYRKI